MKYCILANLKWTNWNMQNWWGAVSQLLTSTFFMSLETDNFFPGWPVHSDWRLAGARRLWSQHRESHVCGPGAEHQLSSSAHHRHLGSLLRQILLYQGEFTGWAIDLHPLCSLGDSDRVLLLIKGRWRVSPVLHGSQWTDDNLQLQRQRWPDAFRHGLHSVCAHREELLRYSVHSLCRYSQCTTSDILCEFSEI